MPSPLMIIPAYFQRIAKDKLGQMMQMEAERMQKLIIQPDIVAVERDVILEERSMRVDGRPSSLLAEQMRKRLHQGTAYEVPVIGWRKEIERLNAEDARAFYRRYYAPDNAVLVVAGAVTVNEVTALAQRHYGPLKPSGTPRKPRVAAQDLRVADYMKPKCWPMRACGKIAGGVIIACRNINAPTNGNSPLPMCWQKFSAAASPDGFIRLWWLKKNWRSAPVLIAIPAASIMANLSFTQRPAPQTDFADLAQAIEAEIDALKNLMASDDELRRAKRQLAPIWFMPATASKAWPIYSAAPPCWG